MRCGVGIACAAVIAAVAFAAPVTAAPLQVSTAAPAVTDVSAQTRVKRKVPQIRVTPRYPYRTYHSAYPLPYDYEYPGPNAKRACVAQLVQEARPSGTVALFRTRCWWVRG